MDDDDDDDDDDDGGGGGGGGFDGWAGAHLAMFSAVPKPRYTIKSTARECSQPQPPPPSLTGHPYCDGQLPMHVWSASLAHARSALDRGGEGRRPARP